MVWNLVPDVVIAMVPCSGGLEVGPSAGGWGMAPDIPSSICGGLSGVRAGGQIVRCWGKGVGKALETCTGSHVVCSSGWL